MSESNVVPFDKRLTTESLHLFLDIILQIILIKSVTMLRNYKLHHYTIDKIQFATLGNFCAIL